MVSCPPPLYPLFYSDIPRPNNSSGYVLSWCKILHRNKREDSNILDSKEGTSGCGHALRASPVSPPEVTTPRVNANAQPARDHSGACDLQRFLSTQASEYVVLGLQKFLPPPVTHPSLLCKYLLASFSDLDPVVLHNLDTWMGTQSKCSNHSLCTSNR